MTEREDAISRIESATMKYDETNIKYYLYHIDEFIEEVFDVKLMPYQKTLIRKFSDKSLALRTRQTKDIFYNHMTPLCCNLAENKEETGERVENK